MIWGKTHYFWKHPYNCIAGLDWFFSLFERFCGISKPDEVSLEYVKQNWGFASLLHSFSSSQLGLQFRPPKVATIGGIRVCKTAENSCLKSRFEGFWESHSVGRREVQFLRRSCSSEGRWWTHSVTSQLPVAMFCSWDWSSYLLIDFNDTDWPLCAKLPGVFYHQVLWHSCIAQKFGTQILFGMYWNRFCIWKMFASDGLLDSCLQ